MRSSPSTLLSANSQDFASSLPLGLASSNWSNTRRSLLFVYVSRFPNSLSGLPLDDGIFRCPCSKGGEVLGDVLFGLCGSWVLLLVEAGRHGELYETEPARGLNKARSDVVLIALKFFAWKEPSFEKPPRRLLMNPPREINSSVPMDKSSGSD